MSLHISQAKLAESAGISVSHMLDIEYCKTWVSDKTLSKIAKALNIEEFKLLIPEKNRKSAEFKGERAILQKTSELIKAKKRMLRKNMDNTLDDLILEILRLH